jgi:hypothetical protein
MRVARLRKNACPSVLLHVSSPSLTKTPRKIKRFAEIRYLPGGDGRLAGLEQEAGSTDSQKKTAAGCVKTGRGHDKPLPAGYSIQYRSMMQ